MYQLVYTSQADHMDMSSLGSILQIARIRNAECGVTGMLIFAEHRFIQVIEGDEDPVRETFVRIRRDTRHINVRVVRDGYFTHKLFGDWHMGFEMPSATGMRAAMDACAKLTVEKDLAQVESHVKSLCDSYAHRGIPAKLYG